MEEGDSSHVVSLGSFVPFFARQSLPNGNGVNESGGDGVEGDGRRGKHIREDQVRLGLALPRSRGWFKKSTATPSVTLLPTFRRQKRKTSETNTRKKLNIGSARRRGADSVGISCRGFTGSGGSSRGLSLDYFRENRIRTTSSREK